MSTQDYLPREDALLQQWLLNYTSVCQTYASGLGLTPAEIAALTSKSDAFSDTMGFNETAKKAAKAAVAAKNTAKADISDLVRTYTREFKANPTVSDALLEELGVIVSSVTVPPTTVTGLTVNGCDNGVNTLKWNRGTNGQGTIFIIEYRSPNAVTWSFAAAITKTTFDHDDQTPGETLLYRVIATRSGASAAPCSPVIVYGNTGPGEISLAA